MLNFVSVVRLSVLTVRTVDTGQEKVDCKTSQKFTAKESTFIKQIKFLVFSTFLNHFIQIFSLHNVNSAANSVTNSVTNHSSTIYYFFESEL